MRKIIIFILLLIFPLNVLAYSNYIIPGGNNIGIEVKNNGIIVVGFYKINNKYNTNDLKIGDIIIGINDTSVYTITEMINAIEENVKNNKILLKIIRNDEEIELDFELIKVNDIYKTGLYVKDSITGIGTLTYIDPETKIYGALGHEIIESNSLTNIEVREGKIFESYVTGVDRSTVGNAGTKNAKFYEDKIFGNVEKNTIAGIYGKYTGKIEDNNLIEVGQPEELKKGKATIYTVLDGKDIKEYEINITNINLTSKIKNISFEVVSKELLNETGGIVQGMSGSPIIQDGKIYGAVTHVVVSKPNTGYGIFITTMLTEGEKK